MNLVVKIISIFLFVVIVYAVPEDVSARRKKINNEYGTGSNPDSTYINGYFKKNGSYVKGHSRSKRNHTEYDNWGTRGNMNFNTGKRSSRSPRW